MITPDKDTFTTLLIDRLEVSRGISIDEASVEDCYIALAKLVRDQIMKQWVHSSARTYKKDKRKQVYYFSLEFLMGRMLERNLSALGLSLVCAEALTGLGFDPQEVYNAELDPGLGNGGLGRLAACFLDSLAFLDMPGHGCTIRYKYGLFEQKIIEGAQVELPDNWLKNEAVWEIKKPSKAKLVKFYGNVREEIKDDRHWFYHENFESIVAMPYDIPAPGYKSGRVNTLRLWSAESTQQFDFDAFSGGDYLNAVSQKYSAEAISEVLYPDDSNYKNRELRLKQQYFFVSAGIQSIISHYIKHYGDVKNLPNYIAIHINDTHPALAVPELMRILLDEEGLGWDEAWDITVRTISYTNHTILPEALEKWPIEKFKRLLPRIYMIVREINERFVRMLRDKYDFDPQKVHHMAILAGGEVHMAHMAIVGSHAINGVAQVHSEILKHELFKDFYEVYPDRFFNKTNGITHRRWVHNTNRKLSDLITDTIGLDWIYEPLKLQLLDDMGAVRDKSFLTKMQEIKRENKILLAKIIKDSCGVKVDPDSIFDTQVKRIHAYKRQLMLALYIIDLYFAIIDNPNLDISPRTFIVAGKAAPSYHFAKEVIKLFAFISDKVNNDPRVKGLIKVVFLENYRVSLAERIFPATDLSEQISTASMEASGTGNMKFMMNGAVTIGTYDGANVEIFEAVGEGNYIPFGLTVPEVLDMRRKCKYNSRRFLDGHPRLRRIVYDVITARSSGAEDMNFPHIYDSLTLANDEFLVMKDFDAYLAAQAKADKLYKDKENWMRMSAMNIAHSGIFSSDEVIKKYASEIWDL